MSMFEWNESFSIGVAAMDAQHKRLVAMVNRLYEAMRTGKGDAAVCPILQELVSYTLTHFAAEEALMRKVGYPQLNAHLELHKALTDKATELLKTLKDGKMVATVSVAAFLKDWLTTHIQNEDRRYGLHIQAQQTNQY